MQQYDVFLSFMERNVDIAKSFVKGDRVMANSKWAELAESLNSVGPPIKDVQGWKKVWVDWRSNIKRKLAHNRKESRATGGGSYNKYILNTAEERVATLCGLHAVVDGVSDGVSFGVENDLETIVLETSTTPESSPKVVEMPKNSPKAVGTPKKALKQKQNRFTSSLPKNEIAYLIEKENEELQKIRRELGEMKSAMVTVTTLIVDHIRENERHNREIEKILNLIAGSMTFSIP